MTAARRAKGTRSRPRLVQRLLARLRPSPAPGPAPPSAVWLSATSRATHGRRRYRLFVPSGYRGQAVPLLVLLHGCQQTADAMAAATRMNALAERDTFLVLYPEQSEAANRQRCWNWFEPEHQQRGRGDPAWLIGLVRRILREYHVDLSRVWLAGLSAGGAMAAVLAAVYPEVFAAVGVHSGLPYRAADSALSAVVAMHLGAPDRDDEPLVAAGGVPPLIVFHGDADERVNVANARALVAQWLRLDGRAHLSGSQPQAAVSLTVRDVDRHPYTRALFRADGEMLVEEWIVHGLDHAWSGGSLDAAYTDPSGPSASEEMLRFFREHARGVVRRRNKSLEKGWISA